MSSGLKNYREKQAEERLLALQKKSGIALGKMVVTLKNKYSIEDILWLSKNFDKCIRLKSLISQVK